MLARVKNGADAAPMPGLAEWQVSDRAGANLFLKKQFEFAAATAKKLPGIDIHVNVRPDELADAQTAILAAYTAAASNIVVEITEYSPITEDVIAMITSMQGKGVRFALDDVTKTVDNNPQHGYAKTDAHASTFELGKKHAALFEIQKLALSLSACVWRALVYPTPEYAGGKAVPFLQKQIVPYTDGEPVPSAISERNQEIEAWVKEVQSKKPTTRFIIECSLHKEDLVGKTHLTPALDLFAAEGCFAMQGGIYGGRCFPPEVFFEA